MVTTYACSSRASIYLQKLKNFHTLNTFCGAYCVLAGLPFCNSFQFLNFLCRRGYTSFCSSFGRMFGRIWSLIPRPRSLPLLWSSTSPCDQTTKANGSPTSKDFQTKRTNFDHVKNLSMISIRGRTRSLPIVSVVLFTGSFDNTDQMMSPYEERMMQFRNYVPVSYLNSSFAAAPPPLTVFSTTLFRGLKRTFG